MRSYATRVAQFMMLDSRVYTHHTKLYHAHLSETFLSGPHRRVDDLQEQLTSSRVEDEDSSVDWLRRQVTLECLSCGTSQSVTNISHNLAGRLAT